MSKRCRGEPMQTASRFPNPVKTLLSLMSAALLFGLGVLLLLIANPQIAGRVEQGSVREEAYLFEEILINQPFLKLRGGPGHLVPVYRGGHVVGTLIIAGGEVIFRPEGRAKEEFERQAGHAEVWDRFSAVYLPTSYLEMERLRYSLGAQPASAPGVVLEARELVSSGMTGTLTTFGVSRYLFQPPYTLSIYINSNTYGRLAYLLGPRIELVFIETNEKRITVTNPTYSGPVETAMLVAETLTWSALMALLALTAVFLLVIYVLTVDLKDVRLRTGLIREEVTVLASLIITELAGGFLAEEIARPAYFPPLLRAALAAVAVAWIWRRTRNVRLAGVPGSYPGRGLLVGAIVAGLGMIAGNLALPAGFQSLGVEQWIGQTLWSFGVVGIPGEIYRRGFVQEHFERAWGPTWGLVTASLLSGIVALIPRLMIYGTAGGTALAHGLVVLPAYSLILGLLYQRTRSCLASGICRGLLDLFPRVLLF